MSDDLKTNYSKLNKKYQKLLQENKRLEEENDKLNARQIGLYGQDWYPAHETLRTYCLFLQQQLKELPKKICDEIKMQFYYEFEELIPSVMADKIDAIQTKYGKETKSE